MEVNLVHFKQVHFRGSINPDIKCGAINKLMKNCLIVVFLLIAGAIADDYFVFYPGVPINSTTLSNLRASELAKLNSFRTAHGVGTLVTNATLQAAAQAYAQQLCNTLSFSHSPQATAGNYGENLYKSVAYPYIQYYNGTATQKWQDEKNNYNYATGTAIDPSKMIGHFTAQIWKKVNTVGIGFCTATQKYVYSPTVTLDLAVLYVVANYYPTPNVVGQYTQNVFPPV